MVSITSTRWVLQAACCILLSLCIEIVCGQQAKLVIHIHPPNSVVILDTSHIKPEGFLEIAAGTHIIQSWAPHRMLIIDTLEILADSNHFYLKNLPFTAAYTAYNDSLREQKSKALIPLISTAAVVFASGVSLAIVNYKINNYSLLAKEAQINYDEAISLAQLDYYKNQYKEYDNKYDQLVAVNNALLLSATILGSVGIATTLYILKKKRPSYKEETLLSRMDGALMIGSSTAISGTISYKF